MDRGAWWATVHGITKSQTQLNDFTSLHFTSLHKDVALNYTEIEQNAEQYPNITCVTHINITK